MSNEDSQILNPTFKVVEEVRTPGEATIIAEPLEQGFGHTLGNALRRVLLTSLPGCALTRARIAGADHQFSTLPGLKEDVLELSLNLKQIRIRADHNESGVLRINVKGPKKITGADIECEAGFAVVNPDAYIATLAKGNQLEIELTAETGRGYVVADEKQSTGIGEIMLDALYSPVEQVSYKVEQTRVGRRTDYDKLMLDVHTDGTIAPIDAVKQAAQIMSNQFNQIVSPVVVEETQVEEVLSPEEAEVLRLTVEELDLPTRIANALRKGGYKTVGDLVGVPRPIVAKVKNLGEKSVSVVDDALQKKGVSLGE